MLESEKGVAVTLLNWTGEPLKEITVTVSDTGTVSKVESVEQGLLKYQTIPEGLKVTLPLKMVDVLLISR